jgi:D-amino-acid dehydrogenase
MTRSVMVLGAGVIGVCTSYALARRGWSVTLVDRAHGAARETSFANGAQLSYTYTDALAQPALLRKIPGLLAGLDPAFRIRPSFDPQFLCWTLAFLRNCTEARFARNTLAGLELALESQIAMQKLEARHRIDFAQQTAGKMLIYRDGQAFARAQQVSRLKQRDGVEHYILSGGEAKAIEPALADVGSIEGAVWAPREAVGDPHRFCQAMVDILQKDYQVRTVFGFAARTLLHKSDRFVLVGAKGRSWRQAGSSSVLAPMRRHSCGIWASTSPYSP